MKFGRFHGEIRRISWQGLRYISDEKYSIFVAMKSTRFHGKDLGIYLAMKSAEFHEIRRIPR